MRDKCHHASIDGTVAELPMPFQVSIRKLATSWEMYSPRVGAHHILHSLCSGLGNHGEWQLSYYV